MWADGELQEGALQALPATARKRLERIVESALSLSVDRNLLALSDPAPQTCNEQLLSRLELLLGLAASLTHQQGPYR